MIFSPALKDEQYAELYDLVALCGTIEEMRSGVLKAAERWAIKVEFASR